MNYIHIVDIAVKILVISTAINAVLVIGCSLIICVCCWKSPGASRVDIEPNPDGSTFRNIRIKDPTSGEFYYGNTFDPPLNLPENPIDGETVTIRGIKYAYQEERQAWLLHPR